MSVIEAHHADALSKQRLVLCGSLGNYERGGGHWMALLQYVRGLCDLGHDVFWWDLSDTRIPVDARPGKRLMRRLRRCGVSSTHIALIELTNDSSGAGVASLQGMDWTRVREVARNADMVWNFCGSLPKQLLTLFHHRVLIDLDPGILQLSALEWDMNIAEHHTLLTVGTSIHEAECRVPTLGRRWQGFLPPVFLEWWRPRTHHDSRAAFTSVTEWTWHQMALNGQLISASKRDAYLAYLELPQRTTTPMTLAAHIHADDTTGDRERLIRHGWKLVDPQRVTRTPAAYRQFIRRSRAEFGCVKPIYRELRTGWFSDRSACYLAAGRPVLVEATGLPDSLPTGEGLVVFRNMEEAVEGIRRIQSDYDRHASAAREWAAQWLDSRKTLPKMLAACG